MAANFDEGPHEETALLAQPSSCSTVPNASKAPTPLPKLQISILLLLQLCEPITSKCIYPFINQLISELDITGGDERSVGYYAGLIESLFFATEAATILQWSRLSDQVGRKPVVLIGLSGICASLFCFGLSTTFWGLVISRCLSGMLNGNTGVIKALMGEVTDKTNMAQGFALIPITWCVGGTIGPFLGGTLSRPHERFPRYFSAQFWKTYPYFLPCAAAGSISAVTFVVVLLFLKETVHKNKPDGEADVDLTLVETQDEPGPVPASGPKQSKEDPVPLRELLVFPIVISITNYVLLAFLDTSKNALLPLFLSTPIEFGGLGLSPPTIGMALGLYGLSDGIFQALFFSAAVRRWGPKRVFMCGMAAFLPVYALFPLMSMLAEILGLSPLVWVALVVQFILAIIVDTAFGCIFMFITSAAPNRRSLGATNGLSQTSASIARATGPAMATSLFAFSAQHSLLGGHGVYVVFLALACFSLLVAARLPDQMWTREEEIE